MAKCCLWRQVLGEVWAPLASNMSSGLRTVVPASWVLCVGPADTQHAGSMSVVTSSPGMGPGRLIWPSESPFRICVPLEELVKFSETQLPCLNSNDITSPCVVIMFIWDSVCKASFDTLGISLLLQMLSSLNFQNKALSRSSSYITGCSLSVSSACSCSPPLCPKLECARLILGPLRCSIYTHFLSDLEALNAISVMTIPKHVSQPDLSLVLRACILKNLMGISIGLSNC